MQVSSSKKWLSKPALDEQGAPILQRNGKPVLRKSYSVLQDDFFQAMRNAGYSDVERGERGSSEEHLTVTQFKVEREQERLEEITAQTQQKEQQAASLEKKLEKMDRYRSASPVLPGRGESSQIHPQQRYSQCLGFLHLHIVTRHKQCLC